MQLLRYRYWTILWLVGCFGNACGQITMDPSGGTIGQKANMFIGPLAEFMRFLEVICIVAGIGLLLGSVLQYVAHRKNPTEVRISSVIVLFILGLALILLGFLPR